MNTAHPRAWYLRPFWLGILATAVLVLSLSLTGIGYAWRRSAAIAWVRDTGGSVSFESTYGWTVPLVSRKWSDWCEAHRPEWSRKISRIEVPAGVACDLHQVAALSEARNVSLIGTELAAGGLQPITSFSRLRWIRLSETRLSDADLALLAHCPQLEAIEADHTQITDEGLAPLADLQLRSLSLRRTRITDEGLEALRSQKVMFALHLSSPPISKVAAFNLANDLRMRMKFNEKVGSTGRYIVLWNDFEDE